MGVSVSDVSAVLVTRGDVDLDPILESLPSEWEVLEWNNGARAVYRHPAPNRYWNADDLSVYGRFAAIELTSSPVIYVQDDDVVLPRESIDALLDAYEPGVVTCVMSEHHQTHTLDSALVGFGAVFDRELPPRAFVRWWFEQQTGRWPKWEFLAPEAKDLFCRTCDVIFTALTPRKAIDVPYRYLPQASNDDRMSRQAGFAVERERVLDICRKLVAS